MALIERLQKRLEAGWLAKRHAPARGIVEEAQAIDMACVGLAQAIEYLKEAETLLGIVVAGWSHIDKGVDDQGVPWVRTTYSGPGERALREDLPLWLAAFGWFSWQRERDVIGGANVPSPR